jgi:hypothetical protein
MTCIRSSARNYRLSDLILRIDRPLGITDQERLSGDLPVSHSLIFIPPKTIVRADSFVEYTAGAHGATSSSGTVEESGQLRILHFPNRGWPAFEKRVENISSWMAENTHLPPNWGWHWRRLLRLRDDGKLPAEFDDWFLTRAKADEVLKEGIVAIDDTIARWSERRRGLWTRLRARMGAK